MTEVAIQVKERPILFSGAMVRALLDDSKTQTRRALKPQPEYDAEMLGGVYMFAPPKGMGSDTAFAYAKDPAKSSLLLATCPYGKAGDRLWVRETLFWSDHEDSWCYQADNAQLMLEEPTAPILLKKKPAIPSIHMPREASRLLLEIALVRCERLKDISDADAEAEGYSFRGFYELLSEDDQEGFDLLDEEHDEFAARKGFTYSREWYRMLWQDINGDDSWHANPWVWVVDFKVITAR